MIKRLSEVCSFLSGGTPSRSNAQFYSGNIPWISGADFGYRMITTPRCLITEDAISNSATRKVPANTVLLVTRTGVGKVAKTKTEICFSQDITAVLPSKRILDNNYLEHYLLCQKEYLKSQARGATIQGITRRVVAELQIPVPPLPKQKRIAAILDKADELRAKRRHALAELNTLTQSIFIDMFGDPATNPKNWTVGTIDDHTESTNYGTALKANESGQGIPVLRMGNITYDGAFDLKKLKWVELDEKDLGKFTVRKGDLLFNRTNSPELVGKTAVWHSEEYFAYAGYLVRARFDPDAGNPDYVSAYLNSHYGKRLVQLKAKPSINMSNLSASEFRKLPIMWPPVDLQDSFSKKLKMIRSLKDSFIQSSKHGNDLFHSLQQRAFSGKL